MCLAVVCVEGSFSRIQLHNILSHVSMKIFSLNFIINEIFSVEKFPDYGNCLVEFCYHHLVNKLADMHVHHCCLLKQH